MLDHADLELTVVDLSPSWRAGSQTGLHVRARLLTWWRSRRPTNELIHGTVLRHGSLRDRRPAALRGVDR